MSGKITLTMLKPDAVAAGHTGAILNKIAEAGFRFKSLKMTELTVSAAQKFYAVHKGKPFYDSLVEFMTSGPIVAAILEKDNAVADFRTLIGATNPEQAAEGTIRRLFASSLTQNAIHGSDSDENAIIESAFHFAQKETF
ncbi:MAG: nucleoside-diphosphate kinase [Prevotellaceae bacterium]|jgi:nucleoside-diphosphate kinase|nr:nucleoside-diphosphate kinase [Prevotellaceae bacterium]